jgi:hypothetical protein
MRSRSHALKRIPWRRRFSWRELGDPAGLFVLLVPLGQVPTERRLAISRACINSRCTFDSSFAKVFFILAPPRVAWLEL